MAISGAGKKITETVSQWEDVERAIALLRESFELAQAQAARRKA